MIRNTNTNGPALRVLQHLGQLSRGGQDERVGTRRKGLDEPVGPVVHTRINADLGKISANECEIVLLVCPADSVDSADGFLVADTTSEGIAGIRRVRYQSAVANSLDDLCDPMRLRVSRVNFDHFGHARIVGELDVRA